MSATSVGDACAVKTLQCTIVGAVCVSPGESQQAVTQFMLHRFRVVCRENVPLIPTGDFNLDLSGRKNEWFCRLVTAEFSLCVMPEVNAETTCGGTTIDFVSYDKEN